MITSDQLKDVLERTDALKHYLNIDQKKVEYEEEQLRTQAPDFWEDPKRAEEQMKKVKTLERWIKATLVCVSLPMNCSSPSTSIRMNSSPKRRWMTIMPKPSLPSKTSN